MESYRIIEHSRAITKENPIGLPKSKVTKITELVYRLKFAIENTDHPDNQSGGYNQEQCMQLATDISFKTPTPKKSIWSRSKEEKAPQRELQIVVNEIFDLMNKNKLVSKF